MFLSASPGQGGRRILAPLWLPVLLALFGVTRAAVGVENASSMAQLTNVWQVTTPGKVCGRVCVCF